MRTTLRLSERVYDLPNILDLRTTTTFLPDFTERAVYLATLEVREFIHQCINIHAMVIKFGMVTRKKIENDTQLWVLTWIKFLRADQKFYPPARKENLHGELGLYFNRYVAEDDETKKYLGSFNLPTLF